MIELRKMSICLPVFNQYEMVKKWIEQCIQYKGQDIEIIINDDCSQDDIQGLVKSFNDDRIQYYRNDTNLGHDLNIIQSFANSTTNFMFLFRTRDRIIPNMIPEIIRRIEDNPDLSYLTGGAIDEDGKERLHYKTEKYFRGKDAFEAHKKLYIHPSGCLFSKKYVDLLNIRDFILNHCDNKFGFLVHVLLRLQLAFSGDFEIISKPIWIYTHTYKAKDAAVNSAGNRISIYAPQYTEKRFENSMFWIKNMIPNKFRLSAYRWAYDLYLSEATWRFKEKNEDVFLLAHYDASQIYFNIRKERIKFNEIAKTVSIQCMGEEPSLLSAFYNHCIYRSFRNKTFEMAYFYFAKAIRKTRLINIYRYIRMKLSA
jgi:glycosyltransferase involved in cell wall biosynthesis